MLAATALAAIGPRPGVVAGLVRSLSDPVPNVRRAAATGLGALESCARAGQEALAGATRDVSSSARSAATQALERIQE